MFLDFLANVLKMKYGNCQLPKYSHPFAMPLQIELRCIQFPLIIILEMSLQLDWSPVVASSIVWTGFRKKHTCLYTKQCTKHEEHLPNIELYPLLTSEKLQLIGVWASFTKY
jgi:hypothetical protein